MPGEQRTKYAKDLVENDRIWVNGAKSRANEVMTVRTVVSSVQVVRKPVVIVTLEQPDGTLIHRTYGQFTGMSLAE